MNNIVLDHLVIGYGRRAVGDGGLSSSPLWGDGEGFSLTIEGGQLTCLVGPNGIGKSTLLRTLAGLQPALSGRVLVGETDVARLPKNRLARLVGIVLTAQPDVGNLTVDEVVALGRTPYTNFWGTLSAADRRIVDESLQLTGIAHLARKDFGRLSDGERQKVMIAKALAQQTAVILLDEPTAFLDYPSRIGTLQLLRRIAHEQQKTILLSTHDIDQALQQADRLVLLTQQAVVSGSPQEVASTAEFRAFTQMR